MTLESMLADFQANMWVYMAMPVIAGVVGYVTKSLALKMMFLPLEFKGIKPPYLGWQGVVPRKAAKMADTAADLMLGRLIKIDELMQEASGMVSSRELQSIT